MTPTDHAELARLAEAAYHDYALSHISVGGGMRATVSVPAFIEAVSPSRVLALLAEIAALRGENAGLKNRVSCLERLGKEQSTRVMEQATRAKDAERQRDEAVGLLKPFAEAADDLDDRTRNHDNIWEQPAAMNIDAGNLRAARAFLASMEPKT